MPKYRWACDTCGSFNVTCSGNLHFDYEKQDWVFEGTPLDDDFCEDCERETSIHQVFDEEPTDG